MATCERRQTRGRGRPDPRRQRRCPTGRPRRHQHGNRGVVLEPTGCGIGVQRVDGLLHRQRPAVRTRLEHRTRPRQPPGGRPSGCCATAPTSALHAALSSAVPTPIRSDTAPGMRPSPPCLRLSTHTSLPPASHPRPADSAIRARSAWYRPGERSAPPRLPEAGGGIPDHSHEDGAGAVDAVLLTPQIHDHPVTGVSPRTTTDDSTRNCETRAPWRAARSPRAIREP
jgi:hypothetical protein